MSVCLAARAHAHTGPLRACVCYFTFYSFGSALHVVCVRDGLEGRSFCEIWLKLQGKASPPLGSRSVRGRPISVRHLWLPLQNLKHVLSLRWTHTCSCPSASLRWCEWFGYAIRPTSFRIISIFSERLTKLDYFLLHTIFYSLSSLLFLIHQLCKCSFILSSHTCSFLII